MEAGHAHGFHVMDQQVWELKEPSGPTPVNFSGLTCTHGVLGKAALWLEMLPQGLQPPHWQDCLDIHRWSARILQLLVANFSWPLLPCFSTVPSNLSTGSCSSTYSFKLGVPGVPAQTHFLLLTYSLLLRLEGKPTVTHVSSQLSTLTFRSTGDLTCPCPASSS